MAAVRRPVRVMVRAMLVIGVAAGASGCTTPARTLDRAATEQAVAQALGRPAGAEVTGVRCPADLERGKGTETRCRAQVAGADEPLRLLVTQTDDQARLDVQRIDAVLDRRAVAEDLRRTLVETYRRVFDVDCGQPRIVVAAPRSTFTCQASEQGGPGDGDTRKVKATVTNAAGTLRYDVKP